MKNLLCYLLLVAALLPQAACTTARRPTARPAYAQKAYRLHQRQQRLQHRLLEREPYLSRRR